MAGDRRWAWCRPWLAHVAAALIVATMTLGLYRAERRVGATVDEYGHLVRGLAIWWAPDTRLNWPHPPLPHALIALPTVHRAEKKTDFTRLAGWEDADFTKTVKGYWNEVGYEEARKQLVAGRRMMIGLAALVAGWLYWWAQRRMGKVVGLVAVTLWASHTTLLAHAQLVTNDFAAGCCALVLGATLVDLVQRPRWRHAAYFAVACGVSVVTKTSLVAMVGLAIFLLGVCALAGRGGFRRMPIVRRVVRGVAAGTLAVAFSWLTILTVYRFDRAFLTVAEFNEVAEPDTTYARQNRKPIATLDQPADRLVPLPYSYVFGIQFVRAQNEEGHTGWFMGKPNPEGNPAYFKTLAYYKTPLGLMALCTAGVALTLVRWRRALLLPISLILTVAYFELASRTKINLGFRHATPTVAWMVLMGTRGAAELLRLRVGRLRLRIPGAIVVAVCTLACAAGAVAAWPYYLGDFNTLAGGRKGGLAINLAEEDWGQDIPDLARLVKKEKFKSIHYFSRFSTMKQELKLLGVSYRGLDCGKRVEGWVVVGVKDWTERRSCFRWMNKGGAAAEPRHVINDHLLVFKIDKGDTRDAAPEPVPPPEPDEPSDDVEDRP